MIILKEALGMTTTYIYVAIVLKNVSIWSFSL